MAKVQIWMQKVPCTKKKKSRKSLSYNLKRREEVRSGQ